MAVLLRRADPRDATLLAPMNRRLIVDSGHRNPMNVEELTARMHSWLTGEYEAYLIHLDHELAGYCLFRREPEQAVYIRQLYVDDAFRRQGIARAALTWLRREIWRDATRLYMEVLSGNPEGIAFWKSVGFVEYAITMECRPSVPPDRAERG